MRRFLVSLLLMPGLLAAPAFAGDIVHRETGLTIALPESWSAAQDGDVLIATGPGAQLSMVFMVTDIRSTGDLVADVTREMGGQLRDARLTSEPEARRVNTLMQTHAEGVGTCSDGTTCDWDLALVSGARRNLLVVTVGDLTPEEATVHEVYASIRTRM
ncbi:hypothetical protein JYK02_10030 [Corallococcus macrosporus]|uniref:DUF1795 domain-containing protein n=1 Tax=Corallococcus macrosporus TaxID=35 RepID=A0ABS3D865_9BACT|nr:hypothetical protein [Corallococcus macrosporus]MBN8227849.1 hypothetical protein [Corallococcus macrosporus]